MIGEARRDIRHIGLRAVFGFVVSAPSQADIGGELARLHYALQHEVP